MRKEFSEWIESYTTNEKKSIFLTGDLGFGALENIQKAIGNRFVNMGVSEQNMISVSASLAQQGLLPICYSIAPFTVFRPYEQIRLDLALHNLNVKIVGNGGGYGYGIMGATHHALEDLAVLSCLPNFICTVPLCNSDIPAACESLFSHSGPGYLRMGYGIWPKELGELTKFTACRKLSGEKIYETKLTIVGIGPVLLNLIPWISGFRDIDLFAISVLPILELNKDLLDSITRSKKLLVIEEHSKRGGLGENLAIELAKRGVTYNLYHQHAQGYPTGTYGSQEFHRKTSGLDKKTLENLVAKLIT
jgi:transketolase